MENIIIRFVNSRDFEHIKRYTIWNDNCVRVIISAPIYLLSLRWKIVQKH